jgi:hypothetical protein
MPNAAMFGKQGPSPVITTQGQRRSDRAGLLDTLAILYGALPPNCRNIAVALTEVDNLKVPKVSCGASFREAE